MNTEIYFPTGIVTGQAFCNREKERAYINRRLEQNTHIVLISPRRYGKSSLIAQFTKDQGIPFRHIYSWLLRTGQLICHQTCN